MNPARSGPARRSWLLRLGGYALATALLLGLSSHLQGRLNRDRARMGLTRVAPLENAPPVLAFSTVALGSFRGLIANALWMRANDLQNDGQYFEMVQLADWITKLQPRIVTVWYYQAWNMAYNISVKFTDAADRWRWVQRGIQLLRDDGIRYNPREALLYRELAWFYQHKIGQNLDDAHLYYKAQLAQEMQELFGGPRPDFGALIDPVTPEARARADRLRDQYRMDPRVMKEVDDRYGPVEWRLPEAHAIYWATVGLAKSKPKDLITLRRVVYQSMHMVVMRGRLISLDPLRMGPNLGLLPRAQAAYQQMIEEDVEMRHAIKEAHKNFLREMVYIIYTYNRIAEAQRWFQLTREQYPDAFPAGMSLEEYVLARLTLGLSSMTMDRARAVLEGMLLQYFVSLATDEDDRATGLELLARRFHASYNDRVKVRKDAISLPPFDETKRTVLEDVLKPDTGFPPVWAARLRTKLGLAAPTPPAAAPPKAP
jgi:hypothetical protein